MKKYVIPTVKQRRILAIALIIGLLYTLSVYLYYSFESSAIHHTVEENLQTIGNTKINQITQWRMGCLANARSISRSPFSQIVVKRWQTNPANPLYKQLLLNQMRLMKKEYAFEDIFIASREGNVLLPLVSTKKKLDSVPATLIHKAWEARDVVESDFYISSTTPKVYYDILAPIRNERGETMALAVFRTDPNEYLFPLIQSWPTSSRSSETLLLRKDGDSILYLNDLRFMPNSALKLRIPLSKTEVPSVQAALGSVGIVDGYDYRGINTLAYLAPVPNTAWFMVAKVDHSEIFAELTYRTIILIIISAIIILFISAVLIAYYHSLRSNMSQSELKKETELRISQQELVKSKEMYHNLVERMDEGFCVIEMIYDVKGNPIDYRFLEVNPAFEKNTGLRLVVGRTIRELVPNHEQHWFEIYGKVARTGVPLRFEAPADAMQRYFNVFAYRVEGEDTSKVGVLFFDVTDHKEMENLLRDVQRREAIGVLSSGLAHDFNNLLTVMLGNVSFIQTQLPLDHPLYKHLVQTVTAIETAADLTRQILAYSGKGKFQIKIIDLVSEVENSVNLFSVSIPKNVKLVTHLPSTPVYVSGDPGQIKQIIMNLIINGGEAVKDKQGVVTVELSSVTLDKPELIEYEKITSTTLNPGRYALLRIIDTGSGMTPDIITHIFDPFYTTKFIGRGLGLSAVLGIIRSHEGGITIESVEGNGSTFTVVLPRADAPEVNNPAVTPESQSASQDQKTVLVIDDEKDVAMMAKDLLEIEGHTVITESNPIQGIEVYKQKQAEIGVVLLDWTMPEMSGKEVAEALVAINANVKIIIATGYSADDIKSKMDIAKVSGFLQKPYTLKALLSALQNMM
jgi:signal transduction histidine kinase/CheY-like chemotaxis protein